MKIRVRVALVVAAAVALGLACSKKNKLAKAAAFPDSLVNSEVLAIVNGDTLTAKDVQVLAYISMMGATDSLKSRSFNTMLLDRLIDRAVFIQEAEASGVSAPDSAVDKLMMQFSSHFGGAMDDMLKHVGLTTADFRRAIERDLLIRAYVAQKIEPTISVSEADCRAYFDAHTDAFNGVDSVRVRHIILTFKPDDDEKKRADRSALMQKIRKRIQNGEKFERLAYMYSEDGTSQRGGDLGFFARGMMVPAFEMVAFSLKKGEMSEVFQTEFGLHLVKCLDKKAAAPANYDNAKPRIEAMLRQQNLGTDLQNRLKKDRDAAIIVRNYGKGA